MANSSQSLSASLTVQRVKHSPMYIQSTYVDPIFMARFSSPNRSNPSRLYKAIAACCSLPTTRLICSMLLDL